MSGKGATEMMLSIPLILWRSLPEARGEQGNPKAIGKCQQ
jgi:hypothetical protein